jgi:hypothetical protein
MALTKVSSGLMKPDNNLELEYTSQLGTTSVVGAATGYVVRTNYYDANVTAGSGATFKFTGVTTLGKAGNVPNADGYFYDALGQQFSVIGDIHITQFGARAGIDSTAAVQAAIVFGEISGANVYVDPATYTLNSTVNVVGMVNVIGLGNQGLAALTGSGSVKFIGPTAAAAFTLDTGVAVKHNGPAFFDIYVESVDGTGTAFYIDRMNGVHFERVTAYGYTTSGSYGWNWNGTTGAEQYCNMIDCQAILVRNCIRVNQYNGLVVRGGFYQNYDSGALSIQAGSWFLKTETSATDTVLVTGARVQFFEKAIILYGESSKVYDTRFEGCTTAIEVYGPRCQVGKGCSFNNFITGGPGLAIDVKAAATFTQIGTYVYGAMSACPTRNAGTNTIRHDAVVVRQRLDGIAATTIVPMLIAPFTMLASRAKIYVGGAALTAVYGDRWSLTMSGRSGYKDSYNSFFASATIYELWGDADSTTGTAVNPGVMATATLTKYGSGVTIDNTYLEIEYVPY